MSIGYFRKDTSNFVTGAIVESTIYNIPNPVDGKKYDEAIAAVGSNALDIRNWIFANYAGTAGVDVANGVISGVAGEDNDLIFKINTPSNSSESEVIDGWEFAVQHVFDDTGFGVLANYTLVDSENEYNNFILADQPAIVGISDTANLVLFYENNGLQARVAYNWRDEFLDSHGQDTGANPKYVEAYSQIDVSASYDLPMVEGLTIYVEALNITDEYKRVHGRAKEQVLSLAEAGARYSLGARYVF